MLWKAKLEVFVLNLVLWYAVKAYNFARHRREEWTNIIALAEHKVKFHREVELKLASIITVLGDECDSKRNLQAKPRDKTNHR